MSEPIEDRAARATIASVDARVALVEVEQRHLRELMDARLGGLEDAIKEHGTKLDQFIGKMDGMISEGMRQATELTASPLGRQVDERLKKTETWVEVSKEFHAEQRGQRKLIIALIGTSPIVAGVAIVSLLNSLGVI